jgi:hypothetical protein
LAAFYNIDIVEENDIGEWILDSRSKGDFLEDGPAMAASMDMCRKSGLILLKALQAQSDEESEEEGEDEDSDE